MRELKFRAWWRDARAWAYYGTARHGTVDYLSIDPATEGQYTGLNDVNGVEIYEGDIISIPTGFGYAVGGAVVVKWSDDDAMFAVYSGGGEYLADFFECGKPIKVIGNTYENPELVEGWYHDTI
jgi:uncharacterized phage protein (TIGR01671 family)